MRLTLRDVLDYSPETGEFVWKFCEHKNASWNAVRAGKVAGSVDGDGYIRIEVWGKKYRAHRLAWWFVYNEWPKVLLDHRDRDRTNNRINNLREATHAQNVINRTKTKGKYPRGVTPQRGKFRAAINRDGKKKYLGFFDTVEEAEEAYRRAAKQQWGEFAN